MPLIKTKKRWHMLSTRLQKYVDKGQVTFHQNQILEILKKNWQNTGVPC